MKRCGILLATILLFSSAAIPTTAIDFFVAPSGRDTNPGTRAKPFATLERARDAIRELKKAGPLNEPVNVRLHGGTYMLSRAVEFGPEDSGTAACPITYEAAASESAVLDGGHHITGWKRHDGRLWVATLPTENVYAQLMGTNVTARERLDLYAYLLGAKTEFWRAHRQYAGIIHFVYLTCSYPGVYTADHFADVTKLKLDPAFADYLSEAFKPLGVYLNFFQPTLKAGATREFTVMLVNDDAKPLRGQLTLTLETKSGRMLARTTQPFAMPALGSQTLKLPLPISTSAGDCVLKAAARADGQSKGEATISRRWVKLAE